MMDGLDDPVYVPILRTRDAELNGFRRLASDVAEQLLPVMEFTKSRRSKSNKNGAVSKCVSGVEEILQGRPYIGDVTTMGSQGSAETAELVNEDHHFINWRKFVQGLSPACIPVVHLQEPFDSHSVRTQALALIEKSGDIAVRIPPGYEDADALIDALVSALGSLRHVILICDAEFVSSTTLAAQAKSAIGTLLKFGRETRLSVVAGSCFPASVVLPNYGGDAYGKFNLHEVQLSQQVRATKSLGHVLHGDYGLIYPRDLTATVTNWVPRVDVPLDDKVYYHRFRREDGGYVKAAKMALSDPDYNKLACWADDNIREAAKGTPLGRSPSHWIACRVNYHITRQVGRLG